MDPNERISGDIRTSLCGEEPEGCREKQNIDLNNKYHEEDCIVDEITTVDIENNEIKLKERIAQCKNIIDSLKLELNKEKTKLNKESKSRNPPPMTPSLQVGYGLKDQDYTIGDGNGTTNMYSAFVDSKLYCDESVIEYEKQLQTYQNTLNMAQIEKKNAIRKQMLAKAFKLKLLEVENQCNIELLRVKQSLQCLEPLQIIANKWKAGTVSDSVYDLNNFELIPRFPELDAGSGSDVNSCREDLDANSPVCAKGESVSLEL